MMSDPTCGGNKSNSGSPPTKKLMSFVELDYAVSKLYEEAIEKFTPSDEKEIAEWCEMIAGFIESQGWQVEEYTTTLMKTEKEREAN